jgi:6-phosphofructokinase 2
MMRPLVLALNPSIDVEWRVTRVRWEEKNEVHAERRWPGGKGVNVARWLKHLGGRPRLLLPLGGRTGAELAAGLRAERIPARVILLLESTRANVIVTSTGQGQLRFNPLGPKLSRRNWRGIVRETTSELKRASVLVLSGSLPRGLAAGSYAALVRLAHRSGVKTLLDCDGAPFAHAVKSRPFLVKPNQHELEQWRGGRLRSAAAMERAALRLSGITRGWVLVSLGEDGALLVHTRDRVVLRACAPAVQPLNTVGAGDAMLAAVALQIARDHPPADWLRSGVGAGTALTECRAGNLPRLSQVQSLVSRVRVR